ncbi:hypothetical protein V5N11_033075 [Cardamine amara subsp. amara]|uniref:Zinc knuckle CX2CX4HX4C domain-containing protein n=1 Tax=Cardamine amara subsp. amara TaxID=228776 RepID=A0ABD1BNQ4_CARAN
MIEFEYENLKRICGNYCRINHQTSHCPYLSTPFIPMDDSEVQVVPSWEKEKGSNNIFPDEDMRNSQSSSISSFHPISQPPSPRTLMNQTEFVREHNHQRRLSPSSTHQQDVMGSETFSNSTIVSGFKAKANKI